MFRSYIKYLAVFLCFATWISIPLMIVSGWFSILLIISLIFPWQFKKLILKIVPLYKTDFSKKQITTMQGLVPFLVALTYHYNVYKVDCEAAGKKYLLTSRKDPSQVKAFYNVFENVMVENI